MFMSIDEIARTVATKIMMDVESRTEDFAEHFDEENAIEKALNNTLESVELPGFRKDNILEVMANHDEVMLSISVAKVYINGWKEGQAKWAREPYYGLSQKDFV
jgi:NMD protein affecting ribosome stability and mRNA decay